MSNKIEITYKKLFILLFFIVCFSNFTLLLGQGSPEVEKKLSNKYLDYEKAIFKLVLKTPIEANTHYTLISKSGSTTIRRCYIEKQENDQEYGDEDVSYIVYYPKEKSEKIYREKKYIVYPNSFIKKPRSKRTSYEITF